MAYGESNNHVTRTVKVEWLVTQCASGLISRKQVDILF